MLPGTIPSNSLSEDLKINVKIKKIRKNKQKNNDKIAKAKKQKMSSQNEIKEELIFSCKFCNWKFAKWQQIGGH